MTLGLRPGRRVAVFVLAALYLLAGQAYAQGQSTVLPQPTAQIARIAQAEAPKIDGVLDEPVWAKATQLTEFRQMVPVYGAAPSERTVIYVAYDNDNFYLAVHAYDSEPDKLLLTQKMLDGSLNRDDSIHFYLDPDGTRRNAYSFEVNALGGYTDGLIQNSSDFLKTWNTIWAAAGTRTADGWTAEVAIPFRDFAFDPKNANWGFDVFRWIRRKNENVRWSSRPLGAGDNDVSRTGTLEGFRDLNVGAGIDLQLYGVARYSHSQTSGRTNPLTFRPSGNLYYKVTPGLTALLTVNTDFSDTPLDSVQVNTTRFSLVRPETRQFFLQDAASFEFGGRAFSSGFIEPVFNNGRPFFSRNIGLISGQPVSLVMGGKLSGKYENVSVGALSAMTHDPVTGRNQDLSVVRLKMPVTDRAQLGLILTRGDPTSKTKNTLAAGDVQYANPSLLGTGKRLQGAAFYQRTFSSKAGEDDNVGAAVIFPNEPWGGELHWQRIGNNFTPAMGFVNRTGVHEIHASGIYRKRLSNAGIRQYFIQSNNDFFTDLDGKMVSREDRVLLGTELLTGDRLEFTAADVFERVQRSFTVGSKAVIPAGNYSWNYIKPRIETTTNRRFSASFEVQCCDYYNGQDYHTDAQLTYLPDETWGFTFGHTMDMIRLPGGNVNIHILNATTTTNFTPRMNLKTQIQYDNISRRFALLAQYRWEYEPGQELFVASGEAATIHTLLRPRYVSNNQQFIVRLGHRFQF